MKRRKWDPKTKSMIVIQGLKGRPISGVQSKIKIHADVCPDVLTLERNDLDL